MNGTELLWVISLGGLGLGGSLWAERRPDMSPARLLLGVLVVVAVLAAWLAALWGQVPTQAEVLSGWFVIAGVWTAGMLRASAAVRALLQPHRWTLWGVAWLSPLFLLTLGRALISPQAGQDLPTFLTEGLLRLLFVTAFMVGIRLLRRRVFRNWILP